MTAFLQGHDLLERAQETHRRLSEFYDRTSDVVTGAREKMLLEYLSRHEARFAKSLKEYCRTGSPRILRTWFQFAPEDALQGVLAAVTIVPELTLDELVQIAVSLDDCLADYYDQVVESAMSEEIAEAFRELRAEERQEKAELLKNADDLKHI
ncbi:MAG: hypothetical protein HN742_09070 [Lentisphaerae bacterium]|jgi:hypothetical protein|nr:hypothetical protein [Lentisphaerota bacterium]MBT4814762.1 hypothetical protein [Lentisphaerota bacterium]MBT5610628.1 hypothetical protein [Lentisphaerota bacterium]MBT7057285.1 hypothetical protein [Lentisphaerota bacterium]MBT7842011.1 hypothetical protein [Lentisphaerota bacterium]